MRANDLTVIIDLLAPTRPPGGMSDEGVLCSVSAHIVDDIDQY
jgi:hypothetical protein